jgi:CMP-N,N'-diacetyllegionaminic acid synthase
MINGKKILSVITARKGSKGVTGKNYKELLGVPLFLWSVFCSLQSKYIDKTVISSNCEECKKLYFDHLEKDNSLYVVDWIQRPDEFSTDTSKNEEALIHATIYSIQHLNLDPDIIVNLQPTSPVRTGNLLDRCIEEYASGDYDSLLTGSKLTPFLWQKINGKWKYISGNDCCNRKMRQHFLEDDENSQFVMHDSGNVFMMDTDVLLKTQCRIGKKPCVFEIDKMNSIDIDSEFDFQLIENMAKANNLTSLI